MKPLKRESFTEMHPKVIAMYESVLDLLDKGTDLTVMKVSDITRHAGIGKGTAYEYFDCKEDIIAGAIVYDMERMVTSIKKKYEILTDFTSRVNASFDWIMEGMNGQNAFSRFIYYSSQYDVIGKAIIKNVKNKKAEDFSPVVLLRQLCENGREEGKIREDLKPDEAAMMLIGNMVTLIMCISHISFESKSPHPDGARFAGSIDLDKMKDALCSGFLKSVA